MQVQDSHVVGRSAGEETTHSEVWKHIRSVRLTLILGVAQEEFAHTPFSTTGRRNVATRVARAELDLHEIVRILPHRTDASCLQINMPGHAVWHIQELTGLSDDLLNESF